MDRYRKELEHWLSVKKQAEKQIENLTADPVSKIKYAKLFQVELESSIRRKHPSYTSYRRFERYQEIRSKVHERFGYNTSMMTKAEYDEAIKIVRELGY